jgi:hypothetical protein
MSLVLKTAFRPSDQAKHRVHLATDNLDTYFSENPTDVEGLLKLADVLVRHYLTTEAYQRAQNSNNPPGRHAFVNGSPWDAGLREGSESVPQPFQGDQVLANTILRMRDSMLHYEFQHAISDGDIGRAMNVML